MSQGETTRIHEWIERLHAGDETALNELIIHFERRLRGLTRQMIRDFPVVHSCEQTDDVFQKAVLRLCRALRSVTPGSTRDLLRLSAAQVRRELLNLARYYQSRPDLLHRRRSGGSRPGDTSILGRIEAPADPHEHDPCDEVQLLDQWAGFHRAATKLPEPRRETFDLIWYQGMSCDEVARVQQVSERTVRNRWNAARLSIYEALKGNLPGT